MGHYYQRSLSRGITIKQRNKLLVQVGLLRFATAHALSLLLQEVQGIDGLAFLVQDQGLQVDLQGKNKGSDDNMLLFSNYYLFF